MDALRQRLSGNLWLVAGLTFVIGLALGVFYAWVIDPVEWVNATPAHLRADLQEDYLRMAIDSYTVNRDVDLAIQRYQALGEAAEQVLEAVGRSPGEVNPTAIQNFRALVELYETGAETQPAEEPGMADEEAPAEEAAGALGSSAVRFLPMACGATLLLGVLLAVAVVVRSRLASREKALAEAPYAGAEAFEGGAGEAGEAVAADQALATFRTVYTLGDDLYDDSFSIESPTGDFLGECGVGIGDVVGVGEPKKVSAFEVWLFDKNDIQTVTKVLMSEYAYNDEATRTRLAAKGDPVLAEEGAVITLQTASLEVEARIVDMKYGEGPLPPKSYFERLTVELRAYYRGEPTRAQ